MDGVLTIDQIVVNAVLAILGYLIARFTIFVNSKATEVKQRNKWEKLNVYIDLALETVMDTVQATNQSVVRDLKAKSADGKLTDDEKKEILANAVNSVMLTLSDDVKSVLSQAFTDLPAWIETQIESFINRTKIN